MMLLANEIGFGATVFAFTEKPAASGGRGLGTLFAGQMVSQQLRPTDAQGAMTLTLTNVVVGSAYRVEVASTGVVVTSGAAASASVPLTLSYYGLGAATNDLRIKVRKGSAAPLYKPYETLATIGAAAQSIYIAQIPD